MATYAVERDGHPVHRNNDFTYQLPDTRNFKKDYKGMTLGDVATYAESERVAALLGGGFMRNEAILPMIGKLFYSPGGAAVVERANQTGDHRIATGRAFRAGIFSPGTAILGLGRMRENKMGAIQAGNGFPIMVGKALYFLLTAGVTADPHTVETPLTRVHVETYIDHVVDSAVEEISTLFPDHEKLKGEQREALLAQLKTGARGQFLPALTGDAAIDRHTFTPWVESSREALVDDLLKVAKEHLISLYPETIEGKADKKMFEDSWTDKHKGLRENVSNTGWEFLERLRSIEFANHVIREGHHYTFINVEDAQGKDLPLILGMLKAALPDVAVWSDDKQGTGVIVTSGVLTWAGKAGYLSANGSAPLENLKVIMVGAGAGTSGVYDEHIHMGVKPENILVLDTGPKGIGKKTGQLYAIDEGRTDVINDPLKKDFAKGIPAGTTIEEFSKGAHVLINLADPTVLTRNLEWTSGIMRNMVDNALFSFTTNPDPGIKPDWLKSIKPNAYYSSGNQMYPNTFNNFTAFGYIGLGAMLAGATTVNKEMTVAAMQAIHRVTLMGAPEEIQKQGPKAVAEYEAKWQLVPDPMDIRLVKEQSVAVAVAAFKSGASIYSGATTPTEAQVEHFEAWATREAEKISKRVLETRASLPKKAMAYFREAYPQLFAPLNLGDKLPVYWVVPENSKGHFVQFAGELAVSQARINATLTDGELDPRKLTEVLMELHTRGKEGTSALHEAAKMEVRVLVDIAALNPAMGLALAVKRLEMWDHPNVMKERHSVFHYDDIRSRVIELMPKAEGAIDKLKSGINPEGADWNKLVEEAVSLETKRQARAKSYKGIFETLSHIEGESHRLSSTGGMVAYEVVNALIRGNDVRETLYHSAVGMAQFMVLDHAFRVALCNLGPASYLAPVLAAGTISLGHDVYDKGWDALGESETWKKAAVEAVAGGIVFTGAAHYSTKLTQQALARGLYGLTKPVYGGLAVGISSFVSTGVGSNASALTAYVLGGGNHVGVNA